MANFNIAFAQILEDEGLYDNNSNDTGGETVLGLTRLADHDWKGWYIVDEQKQRPNYPRNLNDVIDTLKQLAYSYYKMKYWDKVMGDMIENQQEANSICNSYVNTGAQAIILAQRALNLPETGHMDTETVNALNNKS